MSHHRVLDVKIQRSRAHDSTLSCTPYREATVFTSYCYWCHVTRPAHNLPLRNGFYVFSFAEILKIYMLEHMNSEEQGVLHIIGSWKWSIGNVSWTDFSKRIEHMPLNGDDLTHVMTLHHHRKQEYHLREIQWKTWPTFNVWSVCQPKTTNWISSQRCPQKISTPKMIAIPKQSMVYPYHPCMVYLPTFTIQINQM